MVLIIILYSDNYILRETNMNIFVGCSSCEIDEYKDLAMELGEKIAKSGHSLVFGASYMGLMKDLADGAIKHNGKIIGVVPQCYKEFAYDKCSQLLVTKNVIERKMRILEVSDAFLFLPGGTGTMDELLSAYEEKRAGCMDKPVMVINTRGHFDKFIEFTKDLVNAKFAKESELNLISIVDNIEEAMEHLNK